MLLFCWGFFLIISPVISLEFQKSTRNCQIKMASPRLIILKYRHFGYSGWKYNASHYTQAQFPHLNSFLWSPCNHPWSWGFSWLSSIYPNPSKYFVVDCSLRNSCISNMAFPQQPLLYHASHLSRSRCWQKNSEVDLNLSLKQ